MVKSDEIKSRIYFKGSYANLLIKLDDCGIEALLAGEVVEGFRFRGKRLDLVSSESLDKPKLMHEEGRVFYFPEQLIKRLIDEKEILGRFDMSSYDFNDRNSGNFKLQYI